MAVSSQASLTEGHAQGAVPMRAFSIQYLSLILIILTFTIGVFAAHRLDGDKRKAKAAAVVHKIPVRFPDQMVDAKVAEIGQMNLGALFESGTSELSPDQFDPLAELLLAHDIQAKFIVATPSDAVDADSALAIALGRSAVLYRAFLDRGVPPDAVSVLASDERDVAAVAVNFAKSAEVQ